MIKDIFVIGGNFIFELINKVKNETTEKTQNKKIVKKLSEENYNLFLQVKSAERELYETYDKLEYVLEDELIDYYIYQVQALEKKYEYLIRKAKEIV